MRSLILFILFAGMFFVMQGIYEEKIKIASQNAKIEYKFIPRTYYEEQLAEADLSMKMAPMFNKESPWYDRTIGSTADIPNFKKEKKE